VEEFDVANTGSGYDDAVQEPVLRAMPGGAELIEWFGHVPWFHDDEIELLELQSPGACRLVIRATIVATLAEVRSCRVTFHIDEIVELKLEHFYRQNALFALRLRPAGSLPGPLYGAEPSPSDIEMVLESAVGIEGIIRCRGVSVTFRELPAKKARKQR